MPQTLKTLRQRIDIVSELESVVHTMKALSAATIRQYENAVTALGDYQRTVELGLSAVLRDYQIPRFSQPAVSAPTAVAAVIIGADQGLCGRFNELVVEHALLGLNELPYRQRRVLCISSRVAAQLQDRRQNVEACLSVPGSVDAISHTVEKVLLKIDTWQNHDSISKILLFHNHSTRRSLYQPQRIDLLPVALQQFQQNKDNNTENSWPSRSVPAFTMSRKKLLPALLRQYFFVIIFRACAESLACEHAARLTAMQRAGKNIEEHLQELNHRYQQQRQTAITEELLDIVAGYEALM